MAKTGKDYFGFGRVLSIILAIIPITALILGVATRFSDANKGAKSARKLCECFFLSQIRW